jgi:hypothetical protein
MRKRNFVLVAATVTILVTVWYLFRPELLFIDHTVSEAFPGAANATGAEEPPVVLAEGQFHSVAHESRGKATIYKFADGRRLLRLTNFETSNGPAVFVYLIAAKDAQDSQTVRSAAFVDVGALKGNKGDQSYELPADIDLAKYQAVTIWCQRFSVNFATAPLTVRQEHG